MKKHFVLVFSIIFMLIFSFMFANDVGAANSGKWIDLGQGWRFRVDPPHADNSNGKWHVHVENTHTGVSGSEGVDGTASHGDHMNRIPKKVKDKVKKHGEYKKGKQKQKKLNAAKKKIKSKKLKIDWRHIGDVVIAIGIVVIATGTFFFAGDDIAAWLNLLRTLGC